LYPGVPLRFSSTETAPLTRAPNLGEHTDEVLRRAAADLAAVPSGKESE
jgi:crotonobetainyl-CoA:carnitine CoA-transferase CaiB-like acyl-CoA transferase